VLKIKADPGNTEAVVKVLSKKGQKRASLATDLATHRENLESVPYPVGSP